MPKSHDRNWTLGLDLGTHSLGYAAIAYDDNGIPEEILYAGSIIHGGGQDGKKSHKAKAGEARRARNRYKQLRRNRREMDELLRQHGAPNGPDIVAQAVEALGVVDIFDVRALLASKKILDTDLRSLAVAAAIRHMQSRRGYRNSWLSTEFTINEAKNGYSAQYRQLHNKCSEVAGHTLPDDLTPAQLFVEARSTGVPYRTKALSVPAYDALRKSKTSVEATKSDPSKKAITVEDVLVTAASKQGSLISKDDVPQEIHKIEKGLLYQSLRRADIIRELQAIARVQVLDDEFVSKASRLLIFNVHPSKGIEERVKLDDLPVTVAREHRALKASLVFQSFRITAQVANLRHVDGSLLSHAEQDAARSLLMEWSDTDERPTWADVAAAVGVPKLGKAENLSRPDINTTALRILSKDGALKKFWTAPTTTDAHRVALIGVLTGDASALTRAGAVGSQVQAWMDTLDDKEIASFDVLKFEPGRAAHSEQTMLLLTAFMRDPANLPNDLHTARTTVFGVSDTWSPSPSPLGTPVGNPTVDANIRLVRRVLDMLKARIGCEPSRVVVESARDIVNSAESRTKMKGEATSRKRDKDAALGEALGKYDTGKELGTVTSGVRRADSMRLLLIHEQHGACLYCGEKITLATMEVDHIVPASRGGTNSRLNLAATCRGCNGSKSDTPFAEWASAGTYKDTVVRVKKMVVTHLNKSSALARRKWINRYTAQLKATECERPMESISWAAVEVRDQLEGALAPADKGSRVLIVSGRITSDVRRMGGIDTEKTPILLRYPNHTVKGKSRLDRRHHAIDAAVLTAIRQSTVTVVSERNLLREEAQLAAGGGELHDVTWDNDGVKVTGRWDAYNGSSRDRFAFAQTRNALDALRSLLTDAVAEDRIPVTRVVKWVPSTAKIHEDKIQKFPKHRLGDALPSNLIDRASTPALWTALTRLPDYDEKSGLPEDPRREITVNGKRLTAGCRIGIFPGNGGALAVRGGYANAQGIHHFRFIEKVSAPDKKGSVKRDIRLVRVYTVDAARLHHEGTDVFTAPLRDNTLSMRDAGLNSREAFKGASSWKVIMRGDEITLTSKQCAASGSSSARALHELFPHLTEYRFVVTGFDESNVKLVPAMLSSEGVTDDATESVKALHSIKAKTSIAKLHGTVISRRNILGEERVTGSYALRGGVL